MLRSEIIYYINFALESVALSGNSNEDDIYLRFLRVTLGSMEYIPTGCRRLDSYLSKLPRIELHFRCWSVFEGYWE